MVLASKQSMYGLPECERQGSLYAAAVQLHAKCLSDTSIKIPLPSEGGGEGRQGGIGIRSTLSKSTPSLCLTPTIFHIRKSVLRRGISSGQGDSAPLGLTSLLFFPSPARQMTDELQQIPARPTLHTVASSLPPSLLPDNSLLYVSGLGALEPASL